MKKIAKLVLLSLFIVGLISACGGSEPAKETEAPGSPAAVGSEDGDGSPFDPGSDTKVVGSTPKEGWVDVSGETSGGATAERAAASAPMVEDSAAGMAVESETVDVSGEPEVVFEVEGATDEVTTLTLEQNSRLTAGDVDDNAHWDDYLLYRRNYSGARVLDVDISERHQIWVKDAAGFPVLGARLQVSAGGEQVAVLRTHSDGRAYFFPRAIAQTSPNGPFEIEISANGQTETLLIEGGSSQREWMVEVAPAGQQTGQNRLDILFLIDATGSMADEILQLKENIRAIAARIGTLAGSPDVRFAMTVYRDRGDLYTSQTFEFTPDVDFFAAGLAEVEADGGGDYPEDLNEGLYKAVHVPEWRIEETVSLIFLVADAPPHLDYTDQAFSYATEMRAAAERGIKIYPIASSGLDEQGEYIFRQLAQYTGGRFLFLTYGAGGAGTTGTETDHNVEGYDVTSLDGLVIKIVEEELAHRNPVQ